VSGNRIEALVDEAVASFDRRPDVLETGLDVDAADVLQLRKSCRLLAGAEVLLDAGFYTLVIEASFVAVERVVEFKLLEGGVEPRDLPGTHPGVYSEAARRGILSERVADDLQDLWREHRAKTYYRDGLASKRRAEHLFELASEVHEFVVNRSAKKHECVCG
jgi:HEPN domain-containing protein